MNKYKICDKVIRDTRSSSLNQGGIYTVSGVDVYNNIQVDDGFEWYDGRYFHLVDAVLEDKGLVSQNGMLDVNKLSELMKYIDTGKSRLQFEWCQDYSGAITDHQGSHPKDVIPFNNKEEMSRNLNEAYTKMLNEKQAKADVEKAKQKLKEKLAQLEKEADTIRKQLEE